MRISGDTLKKTSGIYIRLQRNGLSHISTLPVELLSSIFVMCTENHYPFTPPTPLEPMPLQVSTLSLVSRSWHDVARDTPRLWCDIRTEHPTSIVNLKLKRSKPLPITVLGPIKPDGDPRKGQNILAACAHIARWTSARLTSSSSNDFDILTYAGAPNLKSVMLESLGTDPTPLDLFGGNAPFLENLTLCRVPPKWSSPILSNLRLISLKRVDGPGPDQFFRILKGCPQLESLLLFNFAFAIPQGVALPPVQAIELPRLTELGLLHVPFDVITQCAINLRCPALRTLHLRIPQIHPVNGPSETLETILTFVLEYLRKATTSATATSIVTRNNGILVMFVGSPEQLSIQGLGPDQLEGALAVLEQIWLRFPLPRVSIRLEGPGPTPIWHMLDKLPNASTLVSCAAEGVINYLQLPIQVDGTLRWRLPHLETMTISKDNCKTAEDVLRMVRWRLGRLKVQGNVVKQVPTALNRLVLAKGCPMDRPTFMMINAIMEEGKVIWVDEPEME